MAIAIGGVTDVVVVVVVVIVIVVAPVGHAVAAVDVVATLVGDVTVIIMAAAVAAMAAAAAAAAVVQGATAEAEAAVLQGGGGQQKQEQQEQEGNQGRVGEGAEQHLDPHACHRHPQALPDHLQAGLLGVAEGLEVAQVLEVEARMGKRTDQMQPACAPVSSLRNGMPRLQPRRRRGSRARRVRMVRKVLAHGEAVARLLLLLAVPEVTRGMGIVDSHHNHDRDHRAMGKGSSNSSSVAMPRRRRVTFHTWCAETAIRQMMWTGGRTKRMTRMGRRKTSMYSAVCMCVC